MTIDYFNQVSPRPKGKVMPSKTKKQASFMAAVANNPKFAKKAKVPAEVGKEFFKADKAKKSKKGKK